VPGEEVVAVAAFVVALEVVREVVIPTA